VQVIAVALGVGAIVEASAEIYTVLKLVGAAYLVCLGVQAIRHRRSRATDMGVVTVLTRDRKGSSPERPVNAWPA
jgi:threonine/homoserine/homoserine lactone efflux protein